MTQILIFNQFIILFMMLTEQYCITYKIHCHPPPPPPANSAVYNFIHDAYRAVLHNMTYLKSRNYSMVETL